MIRFHFSIAVVISLWLGFVLAISFMESWLKFRAKGVTLPIGLSIGSLVFRALNRVEWLLLIVLGAVFMTATENPLKAQTLIAAGLMSILLIQTLIFLPILDKRAARIISGETNRPSSIHRWFVATEILKLMALAALLGTTA